LFNGPWIDEQREVLRRHRSIANGVFRKIAIRKNRIAQVDVRDLSILRLDRRLVLRSLRDPAVYAAYR